MRTLLVFGTTLVFCGDDRVHRLLVGRSILPARRNRRRLRLGGTGGNGGAGGLPEECQGDPTKDTSLARDQCGTFVDAAAAPNGDGTRAAPYRTIADAAKTDRSRIFICSGDYPEKATVELVNGVEVYGGFTQCGKDADWQWDDGERASLTGPANAPAVRVWMGQTLLRNLDVAAPDATEPGASSIALVTDSVVLDLENVALHAGAGANGADGAMPGTEAKSGQDAAPATASNACDVAILGGNPGVTVCDDGESAGGDGGAGGMVPANNGEAGSSGTPLPDPNPDGNGLGGGVAADGTCSDGDKGKDGDPGAAGKGGADIGSLGANGISGGAGEDGKSGGRAQGGGGGAGAKAGTFCVVSGMTLPGAGASGGGGGGGGCGGKAGGGGAAGGSSIAVVSSSTTFTFAGVLVRAAAGGKGGNGALGKSGGSGGLGSPGGANAALLGSKAGCAGASGGSGGDGGRGGGGRGGHSLGVAFIGAPPPDAGVTFELGAAGAGGEGDPPDGIGSAGSAATTLELGPN